MERFGCKSTEPFMKEGSLIVQRSAQTIQNTEKYCPNAVFIHIRAAKNQILMFQQYCPGLTPNMSLKQRVK